MLNVLRENLKHLRWVLWLVCIGLVGYLGYYFGGNRGGGGGIDAEWAARVDGEPIGAARFFEAARRMDEYYRQLMGDQYEQLRPQLRIGPQAIQALIDEKIQLKEAGKLGLRASEEEIARFIQNDPRLKDASGQFIGKERYTQVIQSRWRGGVEDFERSIGDMITIQKWSLLATEAVDVTDAELEEAYRANSDKARIDYFVVPGASQKIETAVSDAEVSSWYSAHRENYRRSEAKRVRFFVVERQAQAARIVPVTDQDVQSYFASNPSEFTRQEERRASHILFRLSPGSPPEVKEAARAKAEAALARARSGEDFGSLVRELSEDAATVPRNGDLDFFERKRMVPQFSDAVFTTPEGEFAPVTETVFGFHVIKVTGIRPAGPVPFEEVRDTIRTSLEQKRTEDKLQAEASRIRAEISGAQDFDSIASRENLKIEERIIARDEGGFDFGPSPQFFDAVSNGAPGSIAGPLGVARGLAVLQIVEVLPSAVRPLDEVKERVRSDIVNERGRQAAKTAARNALNRHKTVADAAKALGLELRADTEALPGRPLAGTGGDTDELRNALFGQGAAPRSSGVVGVPAGAVVFEIRQLERFDPTQFEAQKESLRQERLNQKKTAFLTAMMDRLRKSHEIEINSELVEAGSGTR